jgi:hypothetical protein
VAAALQLSGAIGVLGHAHLARLQGACTRNIQCMSFDLWANLCGQCVWCMPSKVVNGLRVIPPLQKLDRSREAGSATCWAAALHVGVALQLSGAIGGVGHAHLTRLQTACSQQYAFHLCARLAFNVCGACHLRWRAAYV